MGSPQNLPSNGGNAELPPNPKGKKKKQRHSTPNFASNDKDTELSPDSNSGKRRRGSTFLLDVIKDRSSGVQREVYYNKRGQTIGKTKPKYSSWLGVLALAMVLIDREWKEVTNENKNKLWECVQCPRQPTNVECGFYVMRYMKDLIADESILNKKNVNGKTSNTQKPKSMKYELSG